MTTDLHYDVIVIGGGHAGTEAAWAAALGAGSWRLVAIFCALRDAEAGGGVSISTFLRGSDNEAVRWRKTVLLQLRTRLKCTSPSWSTVAKDFLRKANKYTTGDPTQDALTAQAPQAKKTKRRRAGDTLDFTCARDLTLTSDEPVDMHNHLAAVEELLRSHMCRWPSSNFSFCEPLLTAIAFKMHTDAQAARIPDKGFAQAQVFEPL